MVERCITLYKESRIDQRLHWYDHFFNTRLKRMHDSRGRGHITLDNEGEFQERIGAVLPLFNQRRNKVWGNHKMPHNLKGPWVSPRLLVSQQWLDIDE
jgi:hypothetical protein